MNDEQKEWSKLYNSNIGTREFLRLGCAILIWIFIGVGASITLTLAGYSRGPKVFSIFFLIMIAFPFIARSWQAAYTILRKILGNEKLPVELMSRNSKSTQSRKWWSYLPSVWWLLINLLLMLAVHKWFSK